MKEINYQFRERMARVHLPGRRDPLRALKDGEVEVTDRYCITIPREADTVMKNAARDLEDYFFTSMGISLHVACESEAAGAVIAYGIDPTLPENSYRLTVKAGEILLVGQNSRMAAQAGYYIEDVMNLCEAPFLPLGEEVRTLLYNPRMVHSGYGLDMFPTEHLLQIAHAGISSLLVFITDVDMTPHGYHDFNDLCRRAAEHGLDVYAYSYLANKLHPEDEGAEEFYENLYGRFLDRCPYFRGFIFVGESFEFPSKDPNTTGIRRKDNVGPDGKPLVPDKPNPGFWPCYDYPIMLRLIQRIIKKRGLDMDIVFWSYNWNRAPVEARKALIDSLPKDITLQATYEMGQNFMRDGFEIRVADYNLFYVGPSDYFTSEAQFAKENGLRFYAMTNTGGRTWDVGVVPYIPAPYRWIERYNGMRDAHDNYGLCGTMDCHHYGFTPSFISELAKWAFSSPTPDLEKTLECIVARDFGKENVASVCEAFRYFGDAMEHIIATNHDQYGPCRIGPSYPFVLFDNKDVEIPTVPYAHFGGNAICFPNYGNGQWGKVRGLHQIEGVTRKFLYEIDNLKKAEALYTKGVDLLAPIVEALPTKKKDEARRILGVAHFIRNTLRTAKNVKEFFYGKEKLLSVHGETRNHLLDDMLAICRAEVENAKETIPLVAFDSSLGYEPSMEYMCDVAHIEWKLNIMKTLMEKELPSYYER